jgi:hypothetical protein
MARRLVIAPAVVLWFVLGVVPGTVLAAGVGVSPGELHFDARQGFSKTLHVINTGDNGSNCTVYVEGEYESWFDFSPSEFYLAPGGIQEVAVTVTPEPTATGSITVSIRVKSFEATTGLPVSVGLIVPAHVNTEGAPVTTPSPEPTPSPSPPPETGEVPGVQLWVVLAIVVPLVLAALVLLWQRRNRAIGAG